MEEDLDLEQFYQSAVAVGFKGLDLAIPALEPEILTLPMNRMRLFLRGMSWLVPQDFLRKAVLTGPIGVFRKGAYAVTSLNPRTHLAKITPSLSQISARSWEAVRFTVRVENQSETVWLEEGRRGRGYVRLGAHLLDTESAVVDDDYGRAELPRDVAKGDAVDVELQLKAPGKPGAYTMELDMVNEGTCWFAEQGSPIAAVGLEVI